MTTFRTIPVLPVALTKGWYGPLASSVASQITVESLLMRIPQPLPAVARLIVTGTLS